MSKEFGLIIPNKQKAPVQTPTVKKPSIFYEDSGSEDESAKPTGLTRSLKRQERIDQEKAVEEDPTVFQYDEIYDAMDQKRKDSKLSRKDLDKKPKYISRLMVAAEKRKRENERRIERQVQKEREAEGEEFKDKESFVTSAYKKKLEEMRALDEEEKREEYLESIGDVRKQGNLDGFYRHLYDQKVNQMEDKEIEIPKVKEEAIESEVKSDSEAKSSAKKENKRRYRKREELNSDESEEESKNLEHLPSNLDADSDFSIDSGSESDDDVKKTKENVKVKKEDDQKKEEVKVEDNAENENVKKIEEEKPAEMKPKINIWKKRTVGIVFDEALQRYYERKAIRESG